MSMHDEHAESVQQTDADDKYLVLVAGSGKFRLTTDFIVTAARNRYHAYKLAEAVAGEGFLSVAAFAVGELTELATAVAGVSVRSGQAVNMTADPDLYASISRR